MSSDHLHHSYIGIFLGLLIYFFVVICFANLSIFFLNYKKKMLKFRYFQRKTQKKGDFGAFSGENWEDCARFSEELEGKGEMCVFYTLSHTIFECNLGTFSREGEGRQGGGER